MERNPSQMTTLPPSASIKRPFVEKDIEEFLRKFVGFLAEMQFDKAKETLETERHKVNFFAFFRFWQHEISAMLQLITAESLYYSLSFFMPTKFSFRKDNHIRDSYQHLKIEFQRCSDNQTELYTNAGEDPTEDFLCKLTREFLKMCSIRIELIDFYLSLAGKDWRNVAVESHKRISEISLSYLDNLPVFDAIDFSYVKEIQALLQLFEIQRLITECNMLDSLLQLKSLKDSLDVWFDQFEAGNSGIKIPTPSFFLSFTKKTSKNNSAKLALLHFLNQFYQALLAKFSLYFYDVIAGFAPSHDSKTVFTANHSFLHLIQNFVKKNNPLVVAILANQIEMDAPFYGFGYHKCLTRFGGNEHCKPASGIHEKYPPLLIFPHEKKTVDGLYANITCFVQEICQSQNTSRSDQNSAIIKQPDSRIRYLYDRNKDQSYFAVNIEANIHMIIVYERKVLERDTGILNFFNDFLSEIRFVKLFHELRNPLKIL